MKNLLFRAEKLRRARRRSRPKMSGGQNWTRRVEATTEEIIEKVSLGRIRVNKTTRIRKRGDRRR